MGMYLQYGTFSHELGEASIRIGGGTEFDEAGRPMIETVTWDIAARAEGDTQADLRTALARAVRAYAARGRRVSARLVTEGGLVAHELNGPASLGGIRVDQSPRFPNADGAEWTTYRNYTVRLSARYAVLFPARAVVSFFETLTFSGGGPDRGMIVVANGPPVPYISAAQTPYRCAQSGSAVGFADYPVWLLRPAFPLTLHEGPLLPVQYKGPAADGDANLNFGLSWQYQFVSAAPLRAVPRTFPRA